MSQVKVYITFCKDNSEVTNKIVKSIERVGINFIPYTRTPEEKIQMEAAIIADNAPIYLLISDNFLKSADCMEGMLQFVENVKLRPRIKPIIIDGKSQKNDGTWQVIPTRFERMSDVIIYMNYWMDEYMNLRRQLNVLQRENSDKVVAFQAKTEVVRKISNEVGDFLRALRDYSCASLAQAEADDYRFFFNAIGYEGTRLYYAYKELPPLPAEAAVEVAETADEMPTDDVLADIPGTALLNKNDNAPADNIETPVKEEVVADAKADEVVLRAREEEAPFVKEQPTADETADNNFENDEPAAPSDWESADDEIDDDLAGGAAADEAAQEETAEPVVADTNAGGAAVVPTLAQALELIQAGQRLLARQALEEILHQSPMDMNVRLEFARFLQDKLFENASAKEQLEEILLSEEANAEVFFRLGNIAAADNDSLVAKNYYERAIAVNRNYAQAYFTIGQLMAKNFVNQEFVAKAYLQEAIRLDGANVAARMELANLYAERFKDMAAAEKELKQILEIEEENALAYLKLAQVCQKIGKIKKARKYYSEATDLDDSLETAELDAIFGIAPSGRRADSRPSFFPIYFPAENQAKTVMVTGATSGIGKALAEAFATNGYRVIMTGRRADRLQEIRDRLYMSHGAQIEILNFDVRDQAATAAALDELPDDWKKIDILINNAGLAKGFSPIHEGSLEHWETMIDTNLKGLLYVTRLVAPWMVARQQGHIVNIGSIAGKEVYPNGNVYCATKHAVVALSKGMRMDLFKHNIRVTCINPGHVETEFALVRFDGNAERAKIYQDFMPLTAQDVASAAWYAIHCPSHVNIEEITLWGTQQASASLIDRSGR